MALSMEEQRILAEIEQELERSEPVLAACLTMFSRPGRAGLLRAPGARRRSPLVLGVASVVALILLTVLPVVIYALVALRGAPAGAPRRSSGGLLGAARGAPGDERAPAALRPPRRRSAYDPRQSCSRYCSRPSSVLRACWNSSLRGSRPRRNRSR